MSIFSLKSMFEAVQQSVADAATSVESSLWKSICDRYFTEKDGNLEPKTVRVMLPHVSNGVIEHQPYEMPLFTLAKHSSLALEKLTVEFDVELRGPDQNDPGSFMASMPRGLFTRCPTAKITIVLKGSDPVEGVMLLNDKILKAFPH